MNRYLALFFLSFTSNLLFSQNIVDHSSSDKPSWLKSKPHSDYYLYYIGMGTAKTLGEARSNSYTEVFVQISSESDSKVVGQRQMNIKTQESYNNNQYENKELIEFRAVTEINQDTLIFSGLRREEEYWILREMPDKSLSYECFTLMRRPKFPHVDPNAEAPQGYSFSEISYRAFVPGWGQLFKREKGKGYFLLITESTFFAGFCVSQFLYADNYNLATKYKGISQNKYETYKANYEDWEKYRNLAGLAFTGFYIYNLIDVLTSKGEQRFAENKKRKLEIIPMFAQNEYKLSLTYHF